jgi:Transglycosylase SLT domain
VRPGRGRQFPDPRFKVVTRFDPDFDISGQILEFLNGCAGASIADLLRMPRHLGRLSVALLLAALAAAIPVAAWNVITRRANANVAVAQAPPAADNPVDARRRADFAAMRAFRPGYAFWQHIFTMPDGSIAFGSAVDGRLLATFPAKGDWMRKAVWADPAIARILEDQHLARKLSERRGQVALLLEGAAGPVVHNSTRGDALLMNVGRYGPFLEEWGAIYERFGVPAEIGLAQVIFESGLNPTKRSGANAVGFCQWLQRNWKRLNQFSPTPIDGRNQTTQAPYCAAYLSVLATKYGSFIPALSEHNAGGTNVGRTLITGEHLGAGDVRERYFLGSKLARDLRALPGRDYEDVHKSYGPRSYLYAEMVFGNTFNIKHLIASTPQTSINAMRTPRSISLAEIVERTGLPADEVRRFNPALVDRVPAQGALYLPHYVSEFGPDVTFWRRPPSPSYVAVLNDFMRLESGPERWDDPAFAPVLGDFKRRFRDTNTEEGVVMETVLEYAMDQAYASSRRTLLTEYRNSEKVRWLIERGVLELDALRTARASGIAAATILTSPE